MHYGLCETGEISRFPIIMFEEYFLETQGRSVGSGKREAKVFKKGQESSWDATLNEPVPQLIRMFRIFKFFWTKYRKMPKISPSMYKPLQIYPRGGGWLVPGSCPQIKSKTKQKW